jgi:hypothetical protein
VCVCVCVCVSLMYMFVDRFACLIVLAFTCY